MSIDPGAVASLIAEIAEEHISPRYRKLAEGDIQTKSGPNDFVTEADLAAEAALEQALRGLYPGAAFIGEEGAARNPAILNDVQKQGAAWIVDPLDGTRNFIQGRDEFGTIVALVEGGKTRMGWIYAIPDKKCLIAQEGAGAEWAGKSLAPLASANGELRGLRAVGALEAPWKDTLAPQLRAGYETTSVRCSAYGYIKMALGERDFALYGRVHPWDHAAGVLTLEEIGGRAGYLDNQAPYTPENVIGRPFLVAGAKDRWDAVSKRLASE
ncbi:MAG: inositol monophosphatase family protein [Pseudomonadota bacterium]